MGIQAVVFDFYGTLAQATHWLSMDDVLAEHGVELPEALRKNFWNGIDGVDHTQHSASQERYGQWVREHFMAMLSETDLHPGEHQLVIEKLEAGTTTRVLEAYPEAAAVLAELRARGLRLGICSNWDWDLVEATEEVGLTDAFDVIVSSAWAGARKPHPRIFEHTLTKLDVDAASVLFVGDTWGPDVVGPRAFGMTPLYLQRTSHWADDTAPGDIEATGVATGVDLRAVLERC
jgi:putative hydrolase of the HAD superfamily